MLLTALKGLGIVAIYMLVYRVWNEAYLGWVLLWLPS